MNKKYSSLMIIIACVMAVLYIGMIPLFIAGNSYHAEMASMRTKLGEVVKLSGEYRSLKGHIDNLERKTLQPKGGGIIQSVNDIAGSIGIKARIKSIKASGSREVMGFIEETGDVVIEKISSNEMVNFLHKIDNAPIMLSIRQAKIRKSFENPELLDVNISISLYNKK